MYPALELDNGRRLRNWARLTAWAASLPGPPHCLVLRD
jgi:hypothetical protein